MLGIQRHGARSNLSESRGLGQALLLKLDKHGNNTPWTRMQTMTMVCRLIVLTFILVCRVGDCDGGGGGLGVGGIVCVCVCVCVSLSLSLSLSHTHILMYFLR